MSSNENNIYLKELWKREGNTDIQFQIIISNFPIRWLKT